MPENPKLREGSAIRSSVFLGMVLISGCAWTEDDALHVATSWSATERAPFEVAYRRWNSSTPGRPATIRWEVLAKGDDLARVAQRSRPPDLILGGPSSSYDRLATQGRLLPDDTGKSWRVAKRSSLGLTVRRRDPSTLDAKGDAPAAPSRRLAFDDPRRDPVALDWAKAVLRSGTWADGYSRLIRQAGGRVPPGRQVGASLAALQRGEADETPSVGSISNVLDPFNRASSFVAVTAWPEWVEGVAVVKGAAHAAIASAFLDHLTEIGQVEPLPAALDTLPEADDLLADLLGSSMVEARDELRLAWQALEEAGRPERAEMWMTQAPPWPPASVTTILAQDANGMAMLETLAIQIAPEADLRAWLVRSWLAPGRLVDDQFLHELAIAAGGRLAREPRFRAWLRSEWTAWARQRFRRVARTAASLSRTSGASS